MKPATKLYAILALELLILSLYQLPTIADFQKFAFYDEGATLHADTLYSNGLRPTIDFGYSYGLLSLLAAHAWFALFGRTPYAYLALINLLNLILLWPLVQLAAGEESGEGRGDFPVATWGLAAILLPHAIFPTNFSVTHPLEAILLSHALWFYVRRRLPGALAFATAAVFVKPTMAYVLGLLLVLAAGIEVLRSRRRLMACAVRLVAPSLLTAACCLGVEAAFFGPLPTVHNILPLTGGRSYAAMNFGLFRAGKEFWLPNLPTLQDELHHYFLSPAAFWIIATLLLFGAAVGNAIRLIRPIDGQRSNHSTLLLPFLAMLHATFLFGFYAWAGSWTYYSWLLFPASMRIAASGNISVKRSNFANLLLRAGFALLAFLALVDRIGDAANRWRYTERTASTAGLFAFPDLQEEFARVRQLPRDKTLFLVNGSLGEMFPDIRTPPSWFLSPAIPTPIEINAIKKQIAASDVIILVNDYGRAEAWRWPEFAAERADFTVQSTGHYLTTLERTATTQQTSSVAR